MFGFTWFEYALCAAVLEASFWLISRSLLRKVDDHRSFALLMQFLPPLLLLPLLIIEPLQLPQNGFAWAAILLAAAAWAFHEVVAFKSLRFTEASVQQTVRETRLVWAAFFAFFFLGESVSLWRIAGIILILAGVAAITFKGRKLKLDYGVKLVLVSAVANASARVFDKLALEGFSVTAYAILVSILTGAFIAVAPTPYGSKQRLQHILRTHWKTVCAAGTLVIASYWFQVKALSVGDVSQVTAVFSLGVVFATVGGILFLKERDNALKKIAGMGLAIAGALLLRM